MHPDTKAGFRAEFLRDGVWIEEEHEARVRPGAEPRSLILDWLCREPTRVRYPSFQVRLNGWATPWVRDPLHHFEHSIVPGELIACVLKVDAREPGE